MLCRVDQMQLLPDWVPLTSSTPYPCPPSLSPPQLPGRHERHPLAPPAHQLKRRAVPGALAPCTASWLGAHTTTVCRGLTHSLMTRAACWLHTVFLTAAAVVLMPGRSSLTMRAACWPSTICWRRAWWTCPAGVRLFDSHKGGRFRRQRGSRRACWRRKAWQSWIHAATLRLLPVLSWEPCPLLERHGMPMPGCLRLVVPGCRRPVSPLQRPSCCPSCPAGGSFGMDHAMNEAVYGSSAAPTRGCV